MPLFRSTFLNYLDSNSGSRNSKEFEHLLVDFLELKFPDLEFCIIQHIYAPDCYRTGFAKECGIKYAQLLKTANHKQTSEMGEFLKLDNLLISPLPDHSDQVKFLIVFNSCPGEIVDDLSIVIREVKEVFRFVSAQIEANSVSINLRTANLVSHIAHDFNSLMALIPEESTKDEALNVRIKYSETLSQEIMFYLRELPVDKSKVPVEDLLSGITSGIPIPDNVDFSLKFLDQFEFITVDVELIDRALSAIIDNAVFATGIEGGNSTMEISEKKNVSLFIDFDWLEIIIRDTGPGIAKEFLKDVRNPFFTTWKDQGHVGLGLSIADKIIQAHNGYLHIESEPGEGTTVTIYLPLS